MMLLPRAVKVYFAAEPANLRRSFDGLSNEVRQTLRLDPLSGHVFIFLNRRRNQVKLLLWTRGGFTIVHKRLERGTFAFARELTGDAKCVPIDVHVSKIASMDRARIGQTDPVIAIARHSA